MLLIDLNNSQNLLKLTRVHPYRCRGQRQSLVAIAQHSSSEF